MELDVEDVNNLSLEEASEWLDERDISYDLLETHDEMLDLIRATLSNAKTNTQKRQRNVREELIHIAKKTFNNVADQLYNHLQKGEVVSILDTWTEEGSPEIIGNDIDVAKFIAENMIRKRLLDVIQTWESDTRIVEGAIRKLSCIFNEKCLVISHNRRKVDEILMGDSLPIEEEESSTTVEGLESKEIVIIVASAPIWIPIGLAALAIFLPTGFGYFVFSSIRDALKSKEYRKNKAHFMKIWTHMLIKSLQKKENVTSLINEVYLTKLLARINYLFSYFLPKQTEADIAMLSRMRNDQRNADQIIHLFRPKKENMEIIFTSMQLFDLKYLADDVADISNILRYKQIGGGSFSDVYRACWKQRDGKEKEVA